MKIPHQIGSILGVTSIIIGLPLFAVEHADDANAPKAKESQKADVDPKKKEGKKQAMIGVGGAPVSKTLSLHLGLKEGNGLTLFHVIPDSAAAKAGLETHDILTSFDGKPIGCQQDLRNAIVENKPGDKVVVEYIHKGEILKKDVVLDLRPARLGAMRASGMNPRWMFKGLGAEVPEADRKRMQAQMEKQIKALQKRLKKEGVLELNFQKGQKGPAKKGGAFVGGFKMNASTSFTMSDAEGSITMKTVNGKKEVVIKDKQGKVVFEGPYDTPQDKAALPDDLSGRVDALNFGKIKAKVFQVEIKPGGMIVPPVPDEDEDAQ